MAGRDMGAHQKKLATGAAVCFIDESGFTLTPHVQRSWALRGTVPVVRHAMGHWQKLSVVSAVVVTRRGTKVSTQIFFRTFPGASVRNRDAADFVRQIGRAIDGRLVVVWDNAGQHRGPALRRLLRKHKRFELVNLPPYCPELNPDEGVWNWLKTKFLAGVAAKDSIELLALVRGGLRRMQRQPRLHRWCIRSSELPFGRLLD